MTAPDVDRTDDALVERGRGRWSRRRLVVTAVVVAVVAGGVVAGTQLTGASGTPTPAAAPGTGTTTVRLTDLHETTPVSGTVGFASPYTIVEPGGNPSAALDKDQQMVASAQGAVAADQAGMADTRSSDAQAQAQARQSLQSDQAKQSSDQATLQDDRATLAADQQKEANDCQGSGSAASGGGGQSGSGGTGASSPCSTDEAKVGSDQTKVDQDQQAVSADQAKVGSDQAQLASAQQKAGSDADSGSAKLAMDQASLAAAQQTAASDSSTATAYGPDSKYTALPAVGQVIDPGKALWSIDGRPAVLLPGALAPWRSFQAGMSAGPDVGVLNRALATLGYGSGLAGSDSFGPGTTAAVDRLQGALGLPQTGTLPLGSAFFSPSPLRVTVVHPLVGAGVAGGQPVLEVTSTTPVVNVALPVNQTYTVKVGDGVTATLPDGTTSSGTITAVGTVATSTSGSGGNNPSATVNVTVQLDHPSSAGTLDQAPVTVNITNQTATNALAVPTTALLALAGGGYALEVVEPDGAHRLEAVSTGIFDDQAGLVQVSGAGVAAGQKVVVPAS